MAPAIIFKNRCDQQHDFKGLGWKSSQCILVLEGARLDKARLPIFMANKLAAMAATKKLELFLLIKDARSNGT